jgi:hypothetical protein
MIRCDPRQWKYGRCEGSTCSTPIMSGTKFGGRSHQSLTGLVKAAVLAHLGRVGGGAQARALEAPCLNPPSNCDALANGGGGLALACTRELLVVHARHIDVDVDPIEQRPEMRFCSRHGVGRTSAVLLAVAVVAAWVRVMSKYQF